MQPARALLLDLDGTLADSLPALKHAYASFLDRFGIAASEEEFRSLNGPPLREVCRILRETHSLPAGVDELYAVYLDMVAEAHRLIRPAAGAETVLSAAQALGWTIAVVTSTPRDAAKHWIAGNGLAKFISFVVGGDDVAQGKPHPDPYRLALSTARVDAIAAIAIEDSPNGARAAIAAGIPTWLLASRVPPEFRDSEHFCGCLPTFASVAAVLR